MSRVFWIGTTHGIAQNGRRWAASGKCCSGTRQVANSRKTNHSDFVGEDVPILRVCVDECHRLLVVLKGLWPDSIFSHGIAQNKSVVAGFQIRSSNRVGFPVGAEAIAAARDHQHSGTCINTPEFAAYILHHGSK